MGLKQFKKLIFGNEIHNSDQKKETDIQKPKIKQEPLPRCDCGHIILDLSIQPSTKLYYAVRAGLVAKGDTLGQWAKRNNESLQMVKYALTGYSNSNKAKKIRKAVIKDIERGNHDQAS